MSVKRRVTLAQFSVATVVSTYSSSRYSVPGLGGSSGVSRGACDVCSGTSLYVSSTHRWRSSCLTPNGMRPSTCSAAAAAGGS